MSMIKTKLVLLWLMALSLPAIAADAISTKGIGMELARDMASDAVLACRAQGYHVSAVVVDRHGLVRATLRDDLAARFTIQIAEEKANMAVMTGMDSGEFRKRRADIRPELNHIDGLIVMEGGLTIDAGGYRIGAIGVSGAPGGDKDADCARKAIEKNQERLDFIQ